MLKQFVKFMDHLDSKTFTKWTFDFVEIVIVVVIVDFQFGSESKSVESVSKICVTECLSK